jgi:hypothetical protein
MSATTYKWAIKTSNKLEQAAKLLRVYCILNNVYPSDTSVLVCAYIMVYGLNEKVKDDILKAGIMGKMSSLKNEIYSLRRLGLLEGGGNSTRISSKIVPTGMTALTNQTLLLINLDNR